MPASASSLLANSDQLKALQTRIWQPCFNLRIGLAQGQELIKLGLSDPTLAALAYRLQHRITVNPHMLASEGAVSGQLAPNPLQGTYLQRRRAGVLDSLTDANLYGLRGEVRSFHRWQKHLVVTIPREISVDAFGRYVANLVREFQPASLILGNEENLIEAQSHGLDRMHWYADRFAAGYRAAKQADASISVRMYGEAYRPWEDTRTFLRTALALVQSRGVLPDALVVHFYDQADQLYRWLAEISSSLVAMALPRWVPLIVGELGHFGDVEGPGKLTRAGAEQSLPITPKEQARAVAQLLAVATASIAEQAFYFAATDAVHDGGYESRKGLLQYSDAYGNVAPRPALRTFQFMVSLLAGAAAQYVANRASGLSGVHFVRPPLDPEETMELEGWIVWMNTQADGPRPFTIPQGYVAFDESGTLVVDARDQPVTRHLQPARDVHLGGETLLLFRLSGRQVLRI